MGLMSADDNTCGFYICTPMEIFLNPKPWHDSREKVAVIMGSCALTATRVLVLLSIACEPWASVYQHNSCKHVVIAMRLVSADETMCLCTGCCIFWVYGGSS